MKMRTLTDTLIMRKTFGLYVVIPAANNIYHAKIQYENTKSNRVFSSISIYSGQETYLSSTGGSKRSGGF